MFSSLWLIDLFFEVSATPDWFLPAFVLFQFLQLFAIDKINERVLTNINFLQLIAFAQLALIYKPNYIHIVVFWVSLVPLLIIATAVSLKDAIFWYMVTLLFIIINGFYAHFITPEYQVTIYPQRFIIGGCLFASLAIFVSFIYYKIQNEQKHELAEKNEEIKQMNDKLSSLNNHLENKVQERTMLLENQNEKLAQYAFTNSHEIRAPLASVLGLLHIIDKSQFKDGNHEIIDKLQDAGQRLDDKIKMLNKILEEDEGLNEIIKEIKENKHQKDS